MRAAGSEYANANDISDVLLMATLANRDNATLLICCTTLTSCGAFQLIYNDSPGISSTAKVYVQLEADAMGNFSEYLYEVPLGKYWAILDLTNNIISNWVYVA